MPFPFKTYFSEPLFYSLASSSLRSPLVPAMLRVWLPAKATLLLGAWLLSPAWRWGGGGLVRVTH